MALQKKKRNLILKFLWKKSQLLKLAKLNLNKSLKFVVSKIYKSQNFINVEFNRYKGLFNLFFNFKLDFFYFLKTNNFFNVFYNENNLIKFNKHFVNSYHLINFLINFHDNILRDLTNLKKDKGIINLDKTLLKWKKSDLSLILKKIKKILKYFFIFLDYFKGSLFQYYILFYNYVSKLYNGKNLFYNNILNFKNLKYYYKIKKPLKFDFILLQKILGKNAIIKYFVKKQMGGFYHHKTYSKNKTSYKNLIFKLRKRKNIRLPYLNLILKIKELSKLNISLKLNKSYIYSVYSKLMLYFFQRNISYPSFLINKVCILNNPIKQKNLYSSYLLYKKNFNYFKSLDSADFYESCHIGLDDNSFFNVFNKKLFSKSEHGLLKKKCMSYQNYYFFTMNWSWHVVYCSKDKLKHCNKNLIFFNNNVNSSKFLYFFYKIYKLRVTFNYLIFLLLPLNLNLIWIELGLNDKSDSRPMSLHYINNSVYTNNWFVKSKTFLTKAKEWLDHYILKKDSVLNVIIKGERVLAKPTIDYSNIKMKLLKFTKLYLSKRFKVKRVSKANCYKFLKKLYLKKNVSFSRIYKFISLNNFNQFNYNKTKFLGYLKYAKLNLFYDYTKKQKCNIGYIYNIKFQNLRKVRNKYYFLKKIKFYLKYKKFHWARIYYINLYNTKCKRNNNLIRQNFFNNFIFSYNKLSDTHRKYTLFNFLISINSKQSYIGRTRGKRLLYFQNILQYFTLRDSSLVTSSLYVISQEMSYIFNSRFCYTNLLFKLKKKKYSLYNNQYLKINKLKIYNFILYLAMNIFFLKKYLYYYFFNIKFFNIFFKSYCVRPIFLV